MSSPISSASRRAIAALGLIALLPAALLAQTPAQQGTANSDPGAKKVLGLADIGRWNRIANAELSSDGKWMAYVQTPNEGDGTLFVQELDGTNKYTVPVGSAPEFSEDGKYVGYYVSPPARAGRAGRGGAAGGRGGGRGAAPGTGAASGPARKFELRDLATGATWDVPDAQSFKFSKDSRWVAVHTNKADPAAKHAGADLVLRELASGIVQNIGNVNLYDFDHRGDLFAYTVDAAERTGNGLYVIDLATNQSHVLSSASKVYDQLAWADSGNALAVLQGDTLKGKVQRENALLVWRDASQTVAPTVYDPAKDASFPKADVLSEFAAPRWSRDGSRIFLGIKEQEDARPNSDEPQANVDVWHWKDDDVQSVQMVRIAQERRATLPAVFDISNDRLVRVADSAMRTVTPTGDPRWAIGRVDTTYRGEVAWGGSHGDYYRVNSATGERTLIDTKLMRTMGTSPNGRWFLYLKNGQVIAYDLDANKHVTLGAGINFVDVTDDHPYEKPIYGVAGWSKDGKYVLLNHRFDLYAVPLDGGKPVNLTAGVGDAQQIQFRLVRLDRPTAGGRGGGRGGFGFGAPQDEDTGVDLSKPLLLSAYGEWTKKSGYYTVTMGGKPAPLIYDDEDVGQAEKAKDADRVIFTRQDFAEAPDYWVTNTSFASPKKVTDADPFIGDYRWGKRMLVDYTSGRGVKLQGILTLPANYEPGKKYPMLVYFYEKLSNTLHQFPMPIFDDRPHFAEYASDGYVVFEPDIVYETGKPGSSALDCVTSGVKKVIDLGYADPAHIGIQGHSWGGYETSYILTHSHMFAAVVTGAPPTDLISFYDETYPGTGTLQQGIVEVGQVRMGGNPWDDKQEFEDQSAIFNVRNITSPFMILQGTADNAVDWHQGLELYGAARRWGKKVIFLSYPGEPHHLAKKENQKDFQQRMKQFFDHYLKGAPEPKWMADGVPQTKKGGPIE
ncbi:MAG TPA: prolyl oligopeptidase family serine peptidase [Gemmatimonadaceae bacterium]|nr:prolyl oligopeptidase family serine peptidase [Gemmatimonadaceae bacterium]